MSNFLPEWAMQMEPLEKARDATERTFVLALAFLWILGGTTGAFIEYLREDITGFALSIFVPGYGGIVTIIALFKNT